jgi:hypothetical protein
MIIYRETITLDFLQLATPDRLVLLPSKHGVGDLNGSFWPHPF